MVCNKNSLCVCHAQSAEIYIQAARLRMRLTLSAQGVTRRERVHKREWEHSGFIFGKGVDASSKIC